MSLSTISILRNLSSMELHHRREKATPILLRKRILPCRGMSRFRIPKSNRWKVILLVPQIVSTAEINTTKTITWLWISEMTSNTYNLLHSRTKTLNPVKINMMHLCPHQIFHRQKVVLIIVDILRISIPIITMIITTCQYGTKDLIASNSYHHRTTINQASKKSNLLQKILENNIKSRSLKRQRNSIPIKRCWNVPTSVITKT